MSDSTFDGFYTPTPDDVPRDSRWPWIVVVAGLAVVISGAVAFSGGAVDHDGGSATTYPGHDSSAQR